MKETAKFWIAGLENARFQSWPEDTLRILLSPKYENRKRKPQTFDLCQKSALPGRIFDVAAHQTKYLAACNHQTIRAACNSQAAGQQLKDR